jgi:hypothetical protein
MSNVSVIVKVSEWWLTPSMIQMKIEIPSLNGMYATWYRRKGVYGRESIVWGWYCNDSQGLIPPQAELAPILNMLVLSHPTLSLVAAEYGINP